MLVVIVCGIFSDARRDIVFEPTTNRPSVSRDSAVPLTVVPDAPGLRVLPAIAITSDAAMIAWPPTVVVMWVGTSGARGTVDVPIIRAVGPNCMGVSDIVIRGTPLLKVVPAIEIP